MEGQSNNAKHPIHQSELPFDLISEMILTRLPIKSVVRFKSVSKLWYSTLSSPHFAYAHLKIFNSSTTQSLFIQSDAFENNFEILSYEDGDQRSQMDNKCQIDCVNEKVDFDVGKESVDLVGSCNGLVCLGSSSGCLFIIWNPITHEFLKYRDSNISKVPRGGLLVTWGFGYVSSVDDYKVVRICRGDRCMMRVHVYSTRFDKFKRIDDNNDSHNFSGLRKTRYLVDPGVLFNETLYWMDTAPKRLSMMKDLPREILSFDLATEIFGTFPHLEVSTRSRNHKDAFSDEFLCVVNGCLSKYGRSIRNRQDILTILKSPGETEQVLFPSFLAGECPVNLIGFTGSNKIFTECSEYHPSYRPDSCLVVIDLTSPPLEHIRLMTLEVWENRRIAKYSASLISPDARVRRTREDE